MQGCEAAVRRRPVTLARPGLHQRSCDDRHRADKPCCIHAHFSPILAIPQRMHDASEWLLAVGTRLYCRSDRRRLLVQMHEIDALIREMLHNRIVGGEQRPAAAAGRLHVARAVSSQARSRCRAQSAAAGTCRASRPCAGCGWRWRRCDARRSRTRRRRAHGSVRRG